MYLCVLNYKGNTYQNENYLALDYAILEIIKMSLKNTLLSININILFNLKPRIASRFIKVIPYRKEIERFYLSYPNHILNTLLNIYFNLVCKVMLFCYCNWQTIKATLCFKFP